MGPRRSGKKSGLDFFYAPGLPKLDWIAVHAVLDDPAPALHCLLRTVMMMTAKALKIVGIEEQILIAFVLLDVVDDLGGSHLFGSQAEAAQWLLHQLPLSKIKPALPFIEVLPLSAFGAVLTAPHAAHL